MDLTGFFGTANLIVTTVVLIVSAGAGFIAWNQRRVRRLAKEAVPVDHDTAKRVQSIETEVSKLDTDMDGIRKRLSHLERSLETVARQSDVTALMERMASVEAGQKFANGMLHSIHEAILRAGAGSGGDDK